MAVLRRATQPTVFTCSGQVSTENFEQYAEFPLLRNRSLGPLAVRDGWFSGCYRC